MTKVSVGDKIYYVTIDNQVFFNREDAIEHLRELRED